MLIDQVTSIYKINEDLRKCPKCYWLLRPQDKKCLNCGHVLKHSNPKQIILSQEDSDEEFEEDFLIVELTEEEEEET